jgi:hypothetical protein
MHQMRKLSDSIDKFVGGILAAAKVAPEIRTETIGAFLPEPPDYSDSLSELCWRFKGDAPVARALPRQMDLLIFERLVHQRELSGSAVTRMGLDRESSARMRRLVAAFLRGCDASFDALEKALTEKVDPGSSGSQIQSGD